MDTALLKLILPEFLVEYFDLTHHEQHQGVLHIYFEEKSDIPKELSGRTLVSHGFHKQQRVQDFPLRSNKVYLLIKRRRWKDTQTQEIVQRDWNMVAKGTRITQEFASFLKELYR